MSLDPQARGARLPAVNPGWRWSSWITRRRERWRREREQQLELTASLTHEQRRRSRSGEYVPDLRGARRWC